MKYHLECTNCGSTFESDYDSQVCQKCSGILEVIYEAKMPKISKINSFWDMEKVMPSGKYVHFYLGNTPLIASKYGESLKLKLEFFNRIRSRIEAQQ